MPSKSEHSRRGIDHTLEDKLPERVQLQMHKYVWAPDAQGV